MIIAHVNIVVKSFAICNRCGMMITFLYSIAKISDPLRVGFFFL
jgi:hypothetical protein